MRKSREKYAENFFCERKEIRKSEAASKANKKAKEPSTITHLVEPNKTAEETIQQPPNTVPLIASLETKTKSSAYVWCSNQHHH